MQSKLRIILIIITSVLILFMHKEIIFAEYDTAKEVLQTYGPGTEYEDKSIEKKYLSEDFSIASGFTESVSIEGNNYWYNPEDEEEIIKLGNKLDRKVKYAQNNKDTMRAFNDATNDQTIHADTKGSYEIIEGFINILSVGFGIIVVLISVGITTLTAIDIAFISLPLFRAELSSRKLFQTTDGSNKIRFVSDDAQYAVLASETNKSELNPLIIYFKNRLFTYMVLAVLLFILLTGKITLLAQLALKLVAGILDIIGQV